MGSTWDSGAGDPANCAFGGPDFRTMLFTARTSVYSLRMTTPGAALPRHPCGASRGYSLEGCWGCSHGNRSAAIRNVGPSKIRTSEGCARDVLETRALRVRVYGGPDSITRITMARTCQCYRFRTCFRRCHSRLAPTARTSVYSLRMTTPSALASLPVQAAIGAIAGCRESGAKQSPQDNFTLNPASHTVGRLAPRQRERNLGERTTRFSWYERV